MNNKEILEKVKNKKVYVGEMEQAKINKSCWIGNISACVLAVVLMITEGMQGHFTAIYALSAVCFTWASVFYFCQYFLAKRPWQVLIGAVLEAAGAVTMIVFYILYSIGVIG
ncbi:MAG: hypothetical protein IJ002_06910 [Clostridia bacterium]|nr:hypothetical protein [Clostridia bacterium]